MPLSQSFGQPFGQRGFDWGIQDTLQSFPVVDCVDASSIRAYGKTMKNASPPAKRKTPGRSGTSTLTRTEQLRLAKRAQRARDREAGQVEVRIKLPGDVAKRWSVAVRESGFIDALTKTLDLTVIEVARYPQLKLLCWNRRDDFLSAADAWSLYERNWRFVEPTQLESVEQMLIESLSARFGRLDHG